MSILHGALAMGRRQAESRMTETFKVFTESSVLNESTGLYVMAEVTVYASVAGRVKYPSMVVQEPSQAGQVLAVQDVHIHTAVGSTPLAVVGTLWRCTASVVDSGLVGRVFRTKGKPQAGQVTASRVPVEEVT